MTNFLTPKTLNLLGFLFYDWLFSFALLILSRSSIGLFVFGYLWPTTLVLPFCSFSRSSQIPSTTLLRVNLFLVGRALVIILTVTLSLNITARIATLLIAGTHARLPLESWISLIKSPIIFLTPLILTPTFPRPVCVATHFHSLSE
jgi:hypothetical protein